MLATEFERKDWPANSMKENWDFRTQLGLPFTEGRKDDASILFSTHFIDYLLHFNEKWSNCTKSLQMLNNCLRFRKNVLRFDFMYIQMCRKFEARASHLRQQLLWCKKHRIIRNENPQFLHLRVQLCRRIINHKWHFRPYFSFVFRKQRPKFIQNHPFRRIMRAKIDNDASYNLRVAFIPLCCHHSLGESLEVHLFLAHLVNRLIIGQICEREQGKPDPKDIWSHHIARFHGSWRQSRHILRRNKSWDPLDSLLKGRTSSRPGISTPHPYPPQLIQENVLRPHIAECLAQYSQLLFAFYQGPK
jgi:hypothetical protein